MKWVKLHTKHYTGGQASSGYRQNPTGHNPAGQNPTGAQTDYCYRIGYKYLEFVR